MNGDLRQGAQRIRGFGVVAFEVLHWRLPGKNDSSGWGYGTAPVAVPGSSTRVLLSLPTGGPRTPWCTIDLATGRTVRGTGMPGYLRGRSSRRRTAMNGRGFSVRTG